MVVKFYKISFERERFNGCINLSPLQDFFFLISNVIIFFKSTYQHPMSSQMFCCLACGGGKHATVLRYFLLIFYAW